MLEEIANLRGGARDCTSDEIVADVRVTTGGRLKGERRVDGWSEQMPRLADTRWASLQVRVGIGDGCS